MQEISQERDFNRVCMNNFGKAIVIVFYADWYEHSTNLTESIKNLHEIEPILDVLLYKCDAVKVPELANRFKVSSVPCVVVTESLKQPLAIIGNETASAVWIQLEEAVRGYKNEFEVERERMYAKIKILLEQPGVLLFIKGTPQDPECKFTRQLLEIISGLGIRFRYYDIIADSDIRHWLRHYNSWPTYPQIYIDGKLLGGLDVLKQKIETNTLELPAISRVSDPKERLTHILEEHKAVLFMDGTPNDDNLAESSKSALEILKNVGIKVSVFNLAVDANLREHLATLSSIPAFYAGKKLVGGIEVLQELAKNEEQLLQKVPGSEWKLDGEKRINYLLKTCAVLAFIQGTPLDTKTPESKKIVEILTLSKVKFDFYNVDADLDAKQHLVTVSSFSEFPQLYIDQELIGGVKVVEKLFNDGDLQILLEVYISQ